MIEITTQQINQKLTEMGALNGICIIRNHENKNECVMYVSDEMFTIPYKMDCTFENILEVRNSVDEGTLVFVFTDKELQEAWIESYRRGGISEERFDRRAEFHRFDEPHELFCVDAMLLLDLTGKYNGIPTEHAIPKWKEYVVGWYKEHLIY